MLLNPEFELGIEKLVIFPVGCCAAPMVS